jgi:hypothetical protein
MPQHGRQGRGQHLIAHHQIGVAQPGPNDPDQHLIGLYRPILSFSRVKGSPAFLTTAAVTSIGILLFIFMRSIQIPAGENGPDRP